jgi:hypothetical protein
MLLLGSALDVPKKTFGVGPINVAPLKIKNDSCNLYDQSKGGQDYKHSYFELSKI